MWTVILLLGLIFIIVINSLPLLGKSTESFTSGKEQLSIPYFDQLRCLFDPKFITPQQKDFQISMSEHSALDPNLQLRRPELSTQKCRTDGSTHCFSSDDYHKQNYFRKFQSSPDVINTRVGFEPKPLPAIKYINHADNYVVPSNSTSREMRADLFDDIILPDLFFKKKMMIKKGQTHPDDHVFNTQIY